MCKEADSIPKRGVLSDFFFGFSYQLREIYWTSYIWYTVYEPNALRAMVTLKNPLDYSKMYPAICDSIFHRASSYSLIKAIALGMRYEEEKAGRL